MTTLKLTKKGSGGPGVYLFKDKSDNVIYVGKALNVKNRIKSHFQGKTEKEKLLSRRVYSIETIPVISELEALLLEAHLIKTHQPFFNTRAKDDKHPLYIKITLNDDYPRVFTVRREEEHGSAYFGPFPSSQTVKRVLKFLRSIFPYDNQKTIGKSPCFWSHIGLCNPCPSAVLKLKLSLQRKEKSRYRENIRRLVAVLLRQSNSVEKSLRREMEKTAKEKKFEHAAVIRDQLYRLEYVTKGYHDISSFLENPNLVPELRINETKALQKLISTHYNLLSTITRIECFDASHTATSNPTVGMSTFVNGEPEKNFYRKFRIRGQVRDDLSFLEEALKRRFLRREWGMPDLVVIDGGKTQVGRAREVLKELRIHVPVVGLVKPFDNLVVPHPARNASPPTVEQSGRAAGGKDGFQILRISDQAALSLLQRLRDEAHRFAGAYHRKLRAKSLST